MAMITVRNLPDAVHRALRAQAARHGRSTEAEVRAILEDAVKPGVRVKLGALLAEIGREADLSEREFATLEEARGRAPATPLSIN
ncbi:plasmid stabilization protein [Thioalkalivibrio sp. XN279]|uniref:FitA-like ribbon-helix-helix domain-containing protein n=1 Tax=Thioalkalivibrio sp. XN279 TaxID=2714953 RepID=UPI0014096D72|nr:plasmid stabilization protein [Thioalkalivibrio sp. XN279]NHA15343.1 plasmid stabilization protein [Thioalkalivibrio sp. XN279]